MLASLRKSDLKRRLLKNKFFLGLLLNGDDKVIIKEKRIEVQKIFLLVHWKMYHACFPSEEEMKSIFPFSSS